MKDEDACWRVTLLEARGAWQPVVVLLFLAGSDRKNSNQEKRIFRTQDWRPTHLFRGVLLGGS